MTPKWVRGLVRRRLGLRTVRSREGFVIPVSEGPRLLEVYRKYELEPEVPMAPEGTDPASTVNV